MNKIQIKIPKISRVLGIIFFILAFFIIGYFTLTGYIYCNSIGNPEMCGIEIMLINLPMVNVYKLYLFLIPFWPNIPESIDLSILVLSNSFFWAFIGMILGLGLNLLIFLFKKITNKSSI